MPVVGIGARKKEIDVPSKNAQKIVRIIRDGVRLKQLIEVTKQDIEKNNQLIIPHAENLAGISGQKSVGFRSQDGTVEVKFTDGINYQQKDMPKIQGILGPLFDQAFTRETTYALNLIDIPEIKKLLGKKYDMLVKEQTIYSHKNKIRDMLSDGDSETSRELRKVIFIEPKKPLIRFDKVAE